MPARRNGLFIFPRRSYNFATLHGMNIPTRIEERQTSMTQQDEQPRKGFIGWAQRQSGPVRFGIFFGGIIGVIVLIFAVSAVLYYLNVRGFPRSVPVALEESVTTEEFVVFDDEDAYPAALATTDNGRLYIGSYISGTIWFADSAGERSEIPGTREAIGSVVGLDVGADGALYVLDRVEPLMVAGAVVWRIAEGEIEQVASLPADGLQRVSLPNDIAVDDAGNLYVVDTDSSLRRIWRFAPGADSGENWWIAPQDPANPAGLAYDSANERLLVTDVARDAIYAIPLDADNPASATETLYLYDGVGTEPPGFNGLTVTPDGTIYVAALAQNEVMRLRDGTLLPLAGGYRGSSDVAYDPTTGRLFVNNWDQSWLTPVQFFVVRFFVEPRLPFSVDMVQVN